MPPQPRRLVRSRRAAGISAIVAVVFGTVLVIWGVAIHAPPLTGGGVLTIGRGIMAALIAVGIGLSGHRSGTFPEGMHKLENVIVAILAASILVVAVELARVSIRHLDGTLVFTRDPGRALPFFIAAAIVGVGLGAYKRRVGRAEECPSLVADSAYSFADAVALLIIGGALALDVAGVPMVDAIAGILVAIFLLVIGARMLRNAVRVLLDASLPAATLDRIRQVATADPAVRRVISVDGRNSGAFVFVHLVVEPATADVGVAGRAAADLELRLRRALPTADAVDIEFGSSSEERRIAVPVGQDGRTASQPAALADSFALVTVDAESVSEPEVVANPGAQGVSVPGVYLAVALGRRGVDALVVESSPRDADLTDTLAAYGVEVDVDAAARDVQSAAEVARHGLVDTASGSGNATSRSPAASHIGVSGRGGAGHVGVSGRGAAGRIHDPTSSSGGADHDSDSYSGSGGAGHAGDSSRGETGSTDGTGSQTGGRP